MIAQTDHPLMLEWLNNACHDGGGFLSMLAHAGLVADHENYSFLRPVLTIMRAKYPQYEASEAVQQELAGVIAKWERTNV